MKFDPYEVTLLAAGIVALLAAIVPVWLGSKPVSLPMVLVATGVLGFAVIPALRVPDPASNLELTEKLTELGVIVSILVAGLSIDRPIGWRSWRPTWRLLAITMPLCIAAIAGLGVVVLGLPIAAAVLLGAVLAPTDPVSADELTVEEPDEHGNAASEDVVRATLTSEAGLNDALAFPFVYLAIVINDQATVSSILEWFALDVVVRVGVGVLVGVACGRVVQWLAFQVSHERSRLSVTGEGFVALAIILIAYGLAELCYGYGFLAVFVAAIRFRSIERTHDYHQTLHAFAHQLEKIAVIVLLLLFGGSLLSATVDAVSVTVVVVAVIIVFVVRPLAGLVALIRTRTDLTNRFLIASFGVRGIGSIYYLAYALRQTGFADPDVLWATVASTIVVSIVVHGTFASAAKRRITPTARSQA